MEDNMDKEIKQREDKVRRQLAAQGFTLRKSRTSTYSVNNQGGYMIVDMQFNRIEAGERYDMSLEEVEAFAKK